MTETKNIEQQIKNFVQAKHYRPIKPRQIAKQLKLSGEQHTRDFKRAIKRLIKSGQIMYGPKHLIMKADGKRKSKSENRDVSKKSVKKDEVVGVFKKAAAGYGFVTPDGSDSKDRSSDIFISHHSCGDAANGDVVQVRVSKRRDGNDSRKSGKIIDVVKRRTHRFVGTYRERGGYGIVAIDNNLFESGILVGDAGAKNCRIGDKVVIEMANFPSASHEGEGVIVQVLGERGKPGVDTETIIHEFGLPGEFPEAVLDSAREQAELFDEKIDENRTDFTDKTVITIDPKTARDFDDAISLERLENGHWQLGVHIADVSHFVPYRSKLDNEAFDRATSVYLPDRVIPMIPEIISNNLASLQPGRVRYCMTAMIEFSDDGMPIATELYRGAIKSVHRFNYEEIDEYLEDDQPWKEKLTPEVFDIVRNMHTLAMKLRGRRMTRGSFDLSLPEVKIDLDDDGKVCGAHTVENTESHQVIEEFMLAANEAVAQRLVDEGLYLMRRIHEAPTEMKLKQLTEFVRHIGIDCGNLQSRFEIKKVIAESEGLPEQRAVHFSILRSMQKAIYSPKEVGHYALASDAYCHFTSPIRRYPDLIVHRMVGELIDGKKPRSDFDRLEGLGKHCSDRERRAEQSERELKKLKLLNYLRNKIGMQMSAVVTGVESYGLFAQGIELPAEGLLPIENLPEDQYQFDRPSRTLNGFRDKNQFKLGDVLKIEVAMVDSDKRQLEFRMLGVSKDEPGGKVKKKIKGRKEKPWEQIRSSGKTRKHK